MKRDKVFTDGRVLEHIGWQFNCNRHGSNLVYDQRKKAETAFKAHQALGCAHGVVLPAYRRKA